MKLHLGGHLSWYDPQKRSWVEIKLSAPTRLGEILHTLGVPVEEIAVGAVNGAAIFSFDDVCVANEDRIELFPPVGGGSATTRKSVWRGWSEARNCGGEAGRTIPRSRVGGL